MYHYKAYVTRVIDGDTFEATADLGFNVSFKGTFRLNGIDTPETWRPSCEEERKHGEEATSYVKSKILNKQIEIITYKAGTGIYGRYTADVTIDGNNLTKLLIENGFEKLTSYKDL